MEECKGDSCESLRYYAFHISVANGRRLQMEATAKQKQSPLVLVVYECLAGVKFTFKNNNNNYTGAVFIM